MCVYMYVCMSAEPAVVCSCVYNRRRVVCLFVFTSYTKSYTHKHPRHTQEVSPKHCSVRTHVAYRFLRAPIRLFLAGPTAKLWTAPVLGFSIPLQDDNCIISTVSVVLRLCPTGNREGTRNSRSYNIIMIIICKSFC